ncbi:MAG: DUF4465 domain-containing protein, partial [Pleurocapsa sp. SU_196_0]|nr:DUF4465 domain-containing protein [Pleurocapsa sp. SU_196_0]
PQIVLGAQFTNTTYAALSMREGDAFSKRFGGPTGSDPDYFRLLVEGIDDLGGSTGIVELMLADYRFADSGEDYILDEWVFLDLSGLGAVRELLHDATSFQLHLTQVIAIGPGEPAQLVHRDQWAFDFFPFPKGYEVQCNTIWAMTDFTAENGATRLIPGSHRYEDRLQLDHGDCEVFRGDATEPAYIDQCWRSDGERVVFIRVEVRRQGTIGATRGDLGDRFHDAPRPFAQTRAIRTDAFQGARQEFQCRPGLAGEVRARAGTSEGFVHVVVGREFDAVTTAGAVGVDHGRRHPRRGQSVNRRTASTRRGDPRARRCRAAIHTSWRTGSS